MARRERIATAALQGLLAADAATQSISKQTDWAHMPREAAERAVELADALMAELDKEQTHVDNARPTERPPAEEDLT